MVINFFIDNFTEMSLNFTAPTVNFSSASYAVSENAIALLTLVINQFPNSDILVSISFLNGTATGIMCIPVLYKVCVYVCVYGRACMCACVCVSVTVCM